MGKGETKTKRDMVKVADLLASPLNPRTTFDATKMAELVESVKARGVLVPLLVRPAPKNGKLEIIAGERRWRAAKIAKVAEVPVVIEEMSDELALETMVIENGQREDVHPLEEAAGFAKLIAFGRTPSEIAGKVGRPTRYVAQRISLTGLISAARKAYAKGNLLLGHALLIGRLPESRQDWALEMATPRWSPPSVERLREILQQRQKNVSSAPFKVSDAELLPKAGACTECPHRSGANMEETRVINKNSPPADEGCGLCG